VSYGVIAGGYDNTAIGDGNFIGCSNTGYITGGNNVICGGTNHTITGICNFVGASQWTVLTANRSAIVCAYNSTITGDGYYNFLGGGYLNDMVGNFNVVTGGRGHTLSNGEYNFIGGGYNSTINASGTYNSIVGGYGNTISGTSTGSTIVGRTNQIYDGTYAFISGLSNKATSFSHVLGYEGWAYLYGSVVQASGFFSKDGDAQTQVLTARQTTTDATPSKLALNGVGAVIAMQDNSTWAFSALVVAKRQDGGGDESAGWTVTGLIKCATGNPSFVGTPTVTSLGADDGSWVLGVSVDNTNDSLQFDVTGASSKTIYWVGRIELAEVVI
jgi:hypothetical protein